MSYSDTTADTDNCSSQIIDATVPRFQSVAPASVTMGYRVRAARTFEHLGQVCELRTRAFGRRQPELAQSLRRPEAADFEPGNLVLMALRQSTGELVGTVRMQTNLNGPLEYETHIELPADYRGLLLAGCARLAVSAGADSANVTRLLFKALYLFAQAQQVSRLLITAEPPRDRLYRLFGFSEVWPGRLFRTESTPQYGCKLLSLELATLREVLAQLNPTALEFLTTYSQDIEIFSAAVAGAWAAPRRNDRMGISGAIPGLSRTALGRTAG